MKTTDLIDYKPGERNFKVVLDSPNSGTVIAMAFDKDVNLPAHSTDSHVIVQILEGNCEFTIEGKVNQLKEGDFIMLAPNTKHSVHAPERFKMLLTKINS